jgi:hypothetical protein
MVMAEVCMQAVTMHRAGDGPGRMETRLLFTTQKIQTAHLPAAAEYCGFLQIFGPLTDCYVGRP